MSNWIVNILVFFLDIFGLFLTEKKVYRLSGYWRVFLLWLHLLFLSDTTVTKMQMKCNWHPHCSHTGWLCADVSHKHTHSLGTHAIFVCSCCGCRWAVWWIIVEVKIQDLCTNLLLPSHRWVRDEQHSSHFLFTAERSGADRKHKVINVWLDTCKSLKCSLVMCGVGRKVVDGNRKSPLFTWSRESSLPS